MPSAIDLIGHNPALQEHWIRRFFAALIDAIVVAVIYLLFALPLGFVSLAWYVAPFLYGIVWLLYSMLLETVLGAIGLRQTVANIGQTDAGRLLRPHPMVLRPRPGIGDDHAQPRTDPGRRHQIGRAHV